MCRVREVDRIGNNEADAAAALGGRRVHHSVTHARGMVTRSCARWYLHRFCIAIARTVLNDDGMLTLKGGRFSREVEIFARLPGPVHLWTSDGYQFPTACISEGDVPAWPFSVGLLLKFVHVLGSLH